MTDRTPSALEAELARMSDQKLVRTVRVLEQAGENVDVRRALDNARPRLVRLKPTRRLSPMRLFCVPFEDFLADTAVVKTAYQRVARAALPALWRTVQAHADEAAIARATERLRAADPEDRELIYECGIDLWRATGPILADAVAAEADTLTHDDNLTIDRRFVLDQARLVSEILDVAGPIQRMKEFLPGKPIGALEADQVKQIDDLLVEVARASPERVAHVLLALGHRMRTPGDLLGLIGEFRFWGLLGTKARITTAMAGFVVDRIQAAVPALLADAEAGRLNRSMLASQLSALIHDMATTAETVKARPGEALFDDLEAARATLHDAVTEGILAPTDRSLLEGMERHRPDRPIADADLDAGGDCGRALFKLRRVAGHVSLDGEVTARLAKYEADATRLADRALENMLPGNPAVETIRDTFFRAVRLAETVAGPGRCRDLLDRGLSRLAEGEPAP